MQAQMFQSANKEKREYRVLKALSEMEAEEAVGLVFMYVHQSSDLRHECHFSIH